MYPRNKRGYTLIELVVTVLIIGILTSIAVPQYLKTVETGKADDAVATVNMIGTTNKMFALDHAGAYVSGAFPTGAGGACGNGTTCAAIAGPPYTSACDLVFCKYLADQDWGDKPYEYNACNGAAGGGGCAANLVAATARGGTAAPAAGAPYNGWGYTVGVTGAITANGGAPPPTF
jgi:prepilin-type N-terminal cleavage/methylation domain-containing protein